MLGEEGAAGNAAGEEHLGGGEHQVRQQRPDRLLLQLSVGLSQPRVGQQTHHLGQKGLPVGELRVTEVPEGNTCYKATKQSFISWYHGCFT